MLTATGNIWDQLNTADAICITTNGHVKKNGEAVMGRGIALQLKNKIPSIARILGTSLRNSGNHTKLLGKYHGTNIVTFPVKPAGFHVPNKDQLQSHVLRSYWRSILPPTTVPGWMCKADISLIIRSAEELVELATTKAWQNVLLPRPGCGNGGLKWSYVEQYIEQMLDNRFTIFSYK